jgi:hypothetical protein
MWRVDEWCLNNLNHCPRPCSFSKLALNGRLWVKPAGPWQAIQGIAFPHGQRASILIFCQQAAVELGQQIIHSQLLKQLLEVSPHPHHLG